MQVDQKELEAVKGVLWPGEQVLGTVRQRRVGPGGSLVTPTTVVVTDKRIIIMNRATFGLRQDYEVIPYSAIASVRREHGIISSSVFIRVLGYDKDHGLLKSGDEEGEIDGLNNEDAAELADMINQKLEGKYDAEQKINQMEEQVDSGIGAYRYCTKCGAKNAGDAKFCAKCGAQLE